MKNSKPVKKLAGGKIGILSSFFLGFSFHFRIFFLLIPYIHNYLGRIWGGVKPVYGGSGG